MSMLPIIIIGNSLWSIPLQLYNSHQHTHQFEQKNSLVSMLGSKLPYK